MECFSKARTRRSLAMVALFFAAFALSACTQKPEAVVENFYQATADKRIEDAINCFSLEDVKETDLLMVKGKLQMVVGEEYARMKEKGGMTSVITKVVENKEDRAYVQAEIKFENGEKKSEDFYLVKASGKWKIRME